MNIAQIHALGVKLQVQGIQGASYSYAVEGVIHELSHIAAVQVFLGYGAREGLDVMLDSFGLDDLNDWMVRLYIAHLRVIPPHWLDTVRQPDWSSQYGAEIVRANRAFYALSDKLEVHAQAATYLVLYRAGLDREARAKFRGSDGGSNRGISGYVERCSRALQKPETGRIADLTERLMLEAVSLATSREMI